MSSNVSGRGASWCILGALLAGMPFSVRSLAHILYEAPCIVAPLQYPVLVVLSSLILSLLLGRYLCGRAREAALAIVDRCGMPVACLALSLSFACELVWFFADYGAYDLYELSNELQSASESLQMTALVLWVLLGVSRASGDSGGAPGARKPVVRAFVVTSLWPVAAPVVCFMAASWTLVPFLICILTALFAYSFLRRINVAEIGRDDAFSIMVGCLGGVLLASGFSEAHGEVLSMLQPNYPFFDPVGSPPKSVVLFLIYAGGIAGVSALSLAIERRGRKRDIPERRLGVDALPESTGLSDRQREVLNLFLMGCKGSEIARRLGISAGSVGAYRARALAKLGCGSLQELRDRLDEIEGERRSQERELSAKKGRRCALAGIAVIATLGIIFFLGTNVLLLRGFELSLEWVIAAAAIARMLGNDEGSRSGRAGEEAFTLVSLVAVGGLVQRLLVSMSGDYGRHAAVILLLAAANRAQIGRVNDEPEPKSLSWPMAMLWGVNRVVLGSPVNMLVLVWGAIYFWSAPLMWEFRNVLIYLTYGLCVIGGLLFVLSLVASAFPVKREDDESQSKALVSTLRSGWGLTEMEAKVILLAAQGFQRLEICRRLFIAPGTVNGCKARAYKKLGIHSAAELEDLLKNSR